MAQQNVSTMQKIAIGAVTSLAIAYTGSYYISKQREDTRNKQNIEKQMILEQQLYKLFTKTIYTTSLYPLEFLDITSLGNLTSCCQDFNKNVPDCHAWQVIYYQFCQISISIATTATTKAHAVRQLISGRHWDGSRACAWKQWMEDLKFVLGQTVTFNGALNASSFYYEGKDCIIEQVYDRKKYAAVQETMMQRRAKYRKSEQQLRVYKQQLRDYEQQLDHKLRAEQTTLLRADQTLKYIVEYIFRTKNKDSTEEELIDIYQQQLARTKKRLTEYEESCFLAERNFTISTSNGLIERKFSIVARQDQLNTIVLPNKVSASPGAFLEGIITGTMDGDIYKYTGRSLTPIWYKYTNYEQDQQAGQPMNEILDNNDHVMEIDNYSVDREGHRTGYSTGWICDKCGIHDKPGTERWFCLQCRSDVCFNCITRNKINVRSRKGQQKQWMWSSDISNDDCWIGTDCMVAKSGKYSGRAPAPQNRDIIEFLHYVCPVPGNLQKKGSNNSKSNSSLDSGSSSNKSPSIVSMDAVQPTIATLLSSEMIQWRKAVTSWLVQAGQAVTDEEGNITINGNDAETTLTDPIVRDILNNRYEQIQGMTSLELADIRQNIVIQMMQRGEAKAGEDGIVRIGGVLVDEVLTDEEIRWRILPLKR